MRYSSNIDNVTSKEWNLNIQQAYLFDWIYSLPSWANKITIGNDVYYFASKTKAVEELPLLTDKVDTMYRHYKQLEELGLITLKRIEGKDFIALTEKAQAWNQLGKKSDSSEKNPSEDGKKSENNSEKNPTYNTTNTDNYTNDNSFVNIASQVLTTYDSFYKEFYNKNARRSTLTEPRLRTIRARLEEFKKHYKGHDFLKAVEFTFKYKALEWKDDPVMKSHFEFETLMRPSNFIKYIEQAIKHNGKPQDKSKSEESKISIVSPFKKREIHA